MNLLAKDFVGRPKRRAFERSLSARKSLEIVRSTTLLARPGKPPLMWGCLASNFVLRFSLANCAFDPTTLRGKLELRFAFWMNR